MMEYILGYIGLMCICMLADMATVQFQRLQHIHFFGCAFIALCIPPFFILVVIGWVVYGVLRFAGWLNEEYPL